MMRNTSNPAARAVRASTHAVDGVEPAQSRRYPKHSDGKELVGFR